MFGLIATIIAAAKGHGVFALLVGLWTFVAFIVAANGNPELAIAPGGLFLIIAICMKNLNKEAKNKETPEQIEKSRENEPVFYCEHCHYIGSYTDDNSRIKCPECATELKKTIVTRGQWLSMSEEEKNTQKRKWFDPTDDAIEEEKSIDDKKSEDITNTESSLLAADTDIAIGAPSETKMISSEFVTTEDPRFEGVSTFTLCPECGTKLLADAFFCPECGTKIIKNKMTEAPIVETKETTSVKKDESVLFCRECGIKLPADALFCPECGTKVIYPILSAESDRAEPSFRISPSVEHEEQNSLSTPMAPLSPLAGKGLPPLLRRAFLLIEDENWTKADAYLERVLDDEPENAFAYLGKLLIEKKVNEIDKLLLDCEGISSSGNFKKALRYAGDEDLRSFLQQFV